MGIILPTRAYNIIKWLVQIVLPASATLYAGLASFWGFPRVTEVVGTITLVTTFLGVVLGLSARSYNNSDARFDGALVVEETDNKLIHKLDIATDPDTIKDKGQLLLKVETQTGAAPVGEEK